MKSTKDEVRQRVDEVLRLRLEGARRHDILQYAAIMGWALRPRQVDEYIRRADDLIVEGQDCDPRQVLAMHLALREELYSLAMADGNYRAAQAALASAARLRAVPLFQQLK